MAWTFDQIAAADPDLAAQVNANLARKDPVLAAGDQDFAAQVNARVSAQAAANPKDPKDPLVAADERWVTYRGTLAPIKVPTGVTKAITAIGVFVGVWTLLGLIALAVSGYCLLSGSRSGTSSQKWGGVFLAFFFGPFYWFYKLGSSTYCKKLKVTPSLES